MTDAEIIRKCAEAAERALSVREDAEVLWVWDAALAVEEVYDPFHNRAQAMELVERLLLTVHWTGSRWRVEQMDQDVIHKDESLLRAICLCAARVKG